VWLLAARAPALVRPLFTMRIGFFAVTRRAIALNFSTLPMLSR
jgi:hypothetical protein